MSCATWYAVPVIKDKAEILKLAQKKLDWNILKKYMTEDRRKMYQYVIDAELLDPLGDLIEIRTDEPNEPKYELSGTDWIIYQDPNDIAVQKYNAQYGTYHQYINSVPKEHLDGLDTYGNTPRIGGYPDIVIKSYDEMISFMHNGFIDEDGIPFNFWWHDFKDPKILEEEKQKAIAQVKRFFTNYPDGIITFG